MGPSDAGPEPAPPTGSARSTARVERARSSKSPYALRRAATASSSVIGTGPGPAGRTMSVAARSSALHRGASDDRCADPVGLAHHELGGPRELIGDADPRGHHDPALRVLGSDVVDEREETGDPDRDVGLAEPPRAPERVGDDHGDVHPGEVLEPRPDPACRGVGIDREGARSALDVRTVDPGVRADETVPGLGDRASRRWRLKHADDSRASTAARFSVDGSDSALRSSKRPSG